MKTNKIQENIKHQIKVAINCKEDLDTASWGYEQGVLITCNEAKLLIEEIEKAIQTQKQATADLINDEIKFLIDLKHNYNHEGESYKQIEERLSKLKQMLVEKND